MQEHAASERHNLHVVNLDPAAEHFGYNVKESMLFFIDLYLNICCKVFFFFFILSHDAQVAFDIRDLISLEDVMEEMELGPNGGLVSSKYSEVDCLVVLTSSFHVIFLFLTYYNI